MPVCIPNLLEGKILAGVLPPEHQPPIQIFLPQHQQMTLVDIESCIDDPSLAPLGSHVKTQNISKPIKHSHTVEPKKTSNHTQSSTTHHGTLMLRRRKLTTPQLSAELDHFFVMTTMHLHWTNLTELDISRNRLTQLPPQITKLVHLKILNVTSNQLTEIPTEIYALKQLETLSLSQNKIQTIPDEMPLQLPHLVTFRIAANLIDTLPRRIDRWIRMRHLQLGSVFGGNRLITLPDRLLEMPQLQELDLSYNQLRSLPYFGRTTRTLQTLNLSHNQLDHLPSSIIRFSQLKSLNLSKNHLTSLPADLVQLHQLELLDISDNLLCIMPAEVLERFETSTLLITGNPLTRPGNCDPTVRHQVAYAGILRDMMQRGVARQSGPSTPQPTDVDATIDQELAYHARQLNIHPSHASSSRSTLIQNQPVFVNTEKPRLFHSLRELAIRSLIRYRVKPEFELPEHLSYDVQHGRVCSSCSGPFVNEWVTSVQVKSFAGHPAVVRRVRFCSTQCFSNGLSQHSTTSVHIHHA